MNEDTFARIWNTAFCHSLKDFMLYRTEETHAFNPVSKNYLHFLASRKQEQINNIYEMSLAFRHLARKVHSFHDAGGPALRAFDLFDIYDAAWNRTQTELLDYTDALSREHDQPTREFIRKIIALAQDFSASVKVGYLMYTAQEPLFAGMGANAALPAEEPAFQAEMALAGT